MDRFKENVCELNQMLDQFKETLQKEIRDPQTISPMVFKRLRHLQTYSVAFEAKIDGIHRNLADTDKSLSKWKTRLQVTTTPGDRSITTVINRYWEYRQRIEAQGAACDRQEVEVIGGQNFEAKAAVVILYFLLLFLILALMPFKRLSFK